MTDKKGLKVFHLLLSEGPTEFNLFAYLTKVRFRKLFTEANIQFRINVEIIKNGNQIISQGRLGGVSDITHFTSKHSLIKAKYPDQTLFYLLDKDIDDSLNIETLINGSGDIVQFVEYNTEHLLLRLAGKNPKNPTDFATLKKFRDYCKKKFKRHFRKEAHKFKDVDYEQIFNNATEEEIKASFSELFSTLA